MLHDLTEGDDDFYMICLRGMMLHDLLLRGMMLHDLTEGDDAT